MSQYEAFFTYALFGVFDAVQGLEREEGVLVVGVRVEGDGAGDDER